MKRKTSPAWNSVLFSSEKSRKPERSFLSLLQKSAPDQSIVVAPFNDDHHPLPPSYLTEVIASRLGRVHTPDATQHHQIPHSIHWEGSFSWLPGFPIFRIFAGAMDAVRCDAHHSQTDRAGSFFLLARTGRSDPGFQVGVPRLCRPATASTRRTSEPQGANTPPKASSTQQCEST